MIELLASALVGAAIAQLCIFAKSRRAKSRRAAQSEEDRRSAFVAAMERSRG